MSRKLVLLDVDKTIIDKKYRLPVPRSRFVAALARAQNAGITVGLNSDSALPTVRSWAIEWGIKGPLLAEQSVLYLQESGLMIPTHDVCAAFRDVRDSFVRRLMSHDGPDGRFLTLVGNVNSIIGSMPSYKVGAEETQTLVAVNGLRGFSLSFFVRQRVKGRWARPEEKMTAPAMERVCNILVRVGKRFNKLWPMVGKIDPDMAYDICVVHHKDTRKRTPVLCLLDRCQFDRVYMIGDDTPDDLKIDGMTQCAVANASDEYKKVCRIVASNPMAAGVMELLEQIEKGA